jgi:DNA-binding MarR family transcriptional regulator
MKQSSVPASEPPLPEGDEIVDEIHQVRHLFRTLQYAFPHGAARVLSLMEGRTLGYISRNPGCTQSDLATKFARDKAQVARVIAALRKSGLITAHGDEADRRILRLHVTPQGATLYEIARERRHAIADQSVANFTPEERRQLFTLLRRLRTNLEPTG